MGIVEDFHAAVGGEQPGFVLPEDMRFTNDNAPPMSTNPKRQYGVRKPSAQFIPPVAIVEESVVMALGADKYTAFNWQDDPVDATTYYSAAMRHLMSWFSGEDRDPESGASHLAHVRACMAILMDCQASGILVDDRPKCASAAEAIKRLTKGARGVEQVEEAA